MKNTAELTKIMSEIGQDNHCEFVDSDLRHAIMLAQRIVERNEDDIFDEIDMEVTTDDVIYYVEDMIPNYEIPFEALKDYYESHGCHIHETESDGKYILADRSHCLSYKTESELRQEINWGIGEWMVAEDHYLMPDELSRLLYECDAFAELAGYIVKEIEKEKENE